jgi:hypothetical protein
MRDESDPPDLAGLLRVQMEGPSHERATCKSDELPSPHCLLRQWTVELTRIRTIGDD